MAAGSGYAPGITPEAGAPRDYPSVAGIEQEILDFLDGRSNGAILFDTLYGDTLHELLPTRLTDLLASWRVA